MNQSKSESKTVITLSPRAIYDRAMENKWFLFAATVAQTHDLGTELVSAAAFKAFCRYEDLGNGEVGLTIVKQFGLSLHPTNMEECDDLLRIMQDLGELPQGTILNGPSDIQ